MSREPLFAEPDFFVLRTAFLPFDELLRLAEGLTPPDRADVETLKADARLMRERLALLVDRPEVREALFLASADLHDALDRWRTDPESKKGRRAERSLLRYVSRMCGRATPFGLFAGCSIGRIGDVTRLQTEDRHHYRRHTRLDMDYLSSLIDTLARDENIRRDLVFRPNSSLHDAAGRLHYAEARLRDRSRSYHLVAVDETAYLLETLARAESGATLATLADALVSDDINDEISEADAMAYVGALADSQILIPELSPAAMGAEPVEELIAQLGAHPFGRAFAEALEAAGQAMAAIDDEPPGIEVQRYRRIAATLETLPAKPELSRLFQVDLFKPASEAMLGRGVIAEIASIIELLHGLRPEPSETPLSTFREAFRARYENREVPLQEALDDEHGIGFGAASHRLRAEASPLLEGFAFPRAAAEARVSWGALDAFLLNALQAHERNGGGLVMELRREDLARFKTAPVPPLPDAMSIMAKLAARPDGTFDVLLSSAGGPSGANLLGRFCHGDAALYACVRDHLRAEELLQPDAIFAEIVHLPEGRIGNVILRPRLREYEIPFLSRSHAPEDRRIALSDLLLSLDGDRIVLRSKRLGRAVIPRLTSAHNYRSSALPAYRFLCALQHQRTATMLSWSWGALESARFLPRVVIGRVALARARWRVQRDEIANDYPSLQRWRRERQVPRFVLLADGDNKLVLDLENVLSVEMLFELVKRRVDFLLEELYPGPDELCATGPDGRFVHELILPLVRKRAPDAARPPATAAAPSALQRTFPPGSEWLYAKLYTGTAQADQLLRHAVAPVVRALRRDGAIDGWFFLRYGDPDWHLRLRFHGDPARLAGEALPRLHQACEQLAGRSAPWKIQLDTYEREIERYGRGDDMLIAERLFEIDSDTVLELLQSDALGDTRWQLTLAGIDHLLDALGLDLPRKHAVIAAVRRTYLDEIRADAPFEHQLGERFRAERKALEALLHGRREGPVLSILRRRTQRLHPLMLDLHRLAAESRLSVRLPSLATSFIHMHANRMLQSTQRSHEVVLYDFLARLYASRMARGEGREG
jgi:thiopeptide-type bacteriocin biosynthesis protein